MQTTRTLLVGLSALAASLHAAAQAPQAPALLASAAPTYRSAFEDYQPFTAADAPADWRRSNDTVREIGGWRAYAREIQGGEPEAPQESRPAASVPAAVDPHAGHPQ